MPSNTCRRSSGYRSSPTLYDTVRVDGIDIDRTQRGRRTQGRIASQPLTCDIPAVEGILEDDSIYHHSLYPSVLARRHKNMAFASSCMRSVSRTKSASPTVQRVLPAGDDLPLVRRNRFLFTAVPFNRGSCVRGPMCTATIFATALYPSLPLAPYALSEHM